MKKTALIILIFVMVLSLGLTASAKGGLQLDVSKTLDTQSKTIQIVINASKNPGFCYLKLNVNYDSSIVELTEVKNGTVTNGSFISNDQSLLWDSANDCNAEGKMASLEFHIIKETKNDEYEIAINAVECYNINEEDISIIGLEKKEIKSNDSPATIDETKKEEKQEKKSNGNNKELLEAIDLAVKDNGYQNISNVKSDDNAFVENVNENVMSAQMTENFKTVEEIVNTYQEIFTENYAEIVNEKADKEQVEKALQSALKKAGATTIKDLTAEQKEIFVKEFEKGMSEISDDIPVLSEKVDTQTAVEAIQKVIEQNTNSQKSEHDSTAGKWIWVFVGVGSISIIAAIVIFVVKIKKQKETKVLSQKNTGEPK